MIKFINYNPQRGFSINTYRNNGKEVIVVGALGKQMFYTKNRARVVKCNAYQIDRDVPTVNGLRSNVVAEHRLEPIDNLTTPDEVVSYEAAY